MAVKDTNLGKIRLEATKLDLMTGLVILTNN